MLCYRTVGEEFMKRFAERGRTPNYPHMFFGVFTASFLLYVYFTSFRFVELSVLAQMVVFNFIFVFTLFPIRGRLTRKLCLLLLGNFVGFGWNFVFSAFCQNLALCSDLWFKAFYVIAYPLLNSLWIVSVWCVSLSALAGWRKA